MILIIKNVFPTNFILCVNNYLSTLIVYLRSFDQMYTDDNHKDNSI